MKDIDFCSSTEAEEEFIEKRSVLNKTGAIKIGKKKHIPKEDNTYADEQFEGSSLFPFYQYRDLNKKSF